MKDEILYSFRRCPYAIRARWAILLSGFKVELREVSLKDKPNELLKISPKATVPVLITKDYKVLDESIEIMKYFLSRSNNYALLERRNSMLEEEIYSIIQQNDCDFKYHLDRYKYANRFEITNKAYHRDEAIKILKYWNKLLGNNNKDLPFLIAGGESLADLALWPFVRQFRNTNSIYFDNNTELKELNKWLCYYIDSNLFIKVMCKNYIWEPGLKSIFP